MATTGAAVDSRHRCWPDHLFLQRLCDEAVIGNGSGNTDCLAMYWSLEGLDVRGSASGGGDGNGVKIDTAKVRLPNNRLCCAVADVVKLVRTANDVEILNNEIWQASAVTHPSNIAQGIDIVGADRTRIAGNCVHDLPDIGMYTKGNARNTVLENNLLVNIGIGAEGHGITLGQSTDIERLVDGDFETYDGIIRNNVVVNTSWACIATSSSSNAHIVNNSCFNTGTTTHGSIFLSNESEIGTKGMRIEISDNIIYGSANTPIIKITQTAVTDFSAFTVENNVYFVTGANPTFDPDDAAPMGFAAWGARYKALSGKTDTSRVLDPQFSITTGPAALTLKSTSPAIDSGKASSFVTSDYRGSARPQGRGFDIGAYEY